MEVIDKVIINYEMTVDNFKGKINIKQITNTNTNNHLQ